MNADRFAKRSRILFTEDEPLLPPQRAHRYANKCGEHGKSDNYQPPQRCHLCDLPRGCCRHGTLWLVVIVAFHRCCAALEGPFLGLSHDLAPRVRPNGLRIRCGDFSAACNPTFLKTEAPARCTRLLGSGCSFRLASPRVSHLRRGEALLVPQRCAGGILGHALSGSRASLPRFGSRSRLPRAFHGELSRSPRARPCEDTLINHPSPWPVLLRGSVTPSLASQASASAFETTVRISTVWLVTS